MAKRKPKTTRKKHVTKPARSLIHLTFLAIFRIIFTMVKTVMRLIAWLIATGWRKAKTNPLAAIALSCFFVVFAFVSANALLQQAHLKTSDEKVRLAPQADLSLITTQHELAEIGLYDGEIDGLSGPKTWTAVENWQKLRQALEQGKRLAGEDELARIINKGGE